MRLTRINGPSALVNEALSKIESRLFFEFNDVANRTSEALEAIEADAGGEVRSDARTKINQVYKDLIDSTIKILNDALQDFIAIGVSNPEYVDSDPAHWAHS